MNDNFSVTEEERIYLRTLAEKQLAYSKLPIMEERKQLWYDHNSLKETKPPVIMEIKYCLDDVLPELKCTSPAGQEIEKSILTHTVNHEIIDDDKVVPDYYTVHWKIDMLEFGLELKAVHADDGNGKEIGYAIDYPLKNIAEDLEKMKPSTYSVDRAYTDRWAAFVEELIGDILPIKRKLAPGYNWYASPSKKAVNLMGLENMMYALIDTPEAFHSFYRFMVDDVIEHMRWLEKEGLLFINNENDYAGSGSYGFCHELPSENYKETGIVTTHDMWWNINSQETVGISPTMYKDFIFPYYMDLAKEFGMTYYGCCEPTHDIWDECISKLPNLRKVSVNPWTDQKFMGEKLRDQKVIYSRKPSPNYLAIQHDFDGEAFRAHIDETLEAAQGCILEFIVRDVYALNGNMTKMGEAVRIMREEIEKNWITTAEKAAV